MPDINNGRERILKYIQENNIQIADLAVAYGMNKQDLTNYLNGKLTGPMANKIVLKIIADYRIR
ncbi:hypothetical protein [Enterococcus asini]|uniref:hypothetical protein n=1 Tax=Enterococcus asini TaxID=57732 RepID=UPI00289236AC|nr:hypothetical protein [Enterococcus asini]MDT2743976.1 hypothetical protein [Enterococcus asini]